MTTPDPHVHSFTLDVARHCGIQCFVERDFDLEFAVLEGVIVGSPRLLGDPPPPSRAMYWIGNPGEGTDPVQCATRELGWIDWQGVSGVFQVHIPWTWNPTGDAVQEPHRHVTCEHGWQFERH